jgi:hypothetical protein
MPGKAAGRLPGRTCEQRTGSPQQQQQQGMKEGRHIISPRRFGIFRESSFYPRGSLAQGGQASGQAGKPDGRGSSSRPSHAVGRYQLIEGNSPGYSLPSNFPIIFLHIFPHVTAAISLQRASGGGRGRMPTLLLRLFSSVHFSQSVRQFL